MPDPATADQYTERHLLRPFAPQNIKLGQLDGVLGSDIVGGLFETECSGEPVCENGPGLV